MTLADDSARLFRNFQRGLMTESELRHSLIQSVIHYNDVDASIALADSLPDWFRDGFQLRLRELADDNYLYNLPWCLEDRRTQPELDDRAQLHRPILRLIVPRMLARL
ncbi:hypothetical protein [Rhodopirellula bahusiensis]|uniref:Uncharacterized protein n=1 Tax=Rhodopirellula bahusiensis TaxID=2014065 RepID=A0A2G1W5S9_9BACT|nr:hypothetical protein [Rhodopirellula bahusiensis]PHQ33999.1 hypothetical protein CEE69_16985 [Rhodopirellula bahusiensis]